MHCFLKHSTLLFLSLFLQSQQVTPTPTSQVSTAKPAQYEVKSFIVFSRSLIYIISYLSDGKTHIPQKGLYCTLQLYRPIASPLDVGSRLLFPSWKYSGVYSVRDATVFLRGVVS